MAGLLVQPGLGAGGVGDELLGLEPQVDLGLGVLQGVAAVDDVPEKRGGRLVTDESACSHRDQTVKSCWNSDVIAAMLMIHKS